MGHVHDVIFIIFSFEEIGINSRYFYMSMLILVLELHINLVLYYMVLFF